LTPWLGLVMPGHASFNHGRRHSFPHCLLTVYRCTRTHSPHPPPRPGHSSPHCLLIVHQHNPPHSPHPPP
jgi:hypothetical protein